MSTEAAATSTATGEQDAPAGHDGHDLSHGAERPKWTHAQTKLTVKIAVAFVVGAIMAGIIGPIVLTIIIGLLQGYHRF